RQLHQLLPVPTDTPAHLMPARARWGHLDLLNVVGRGSYGIVYRAWDTRLERLVALKLFHNAARPEAVIEEGRMLARVRHENVVAIYGADVIDGVAGIWMELVHGRTLDTIVNAHGPMRSHDAAAIGVDIAKALAAVHAAGLLHCDVKAQNVVQEAGGRVVLTDFGAGRLAPEMRDEDQIVDVAGTPRYMAPELFHPGASATRASDIYSLGVLLYFLVTGKYPVAGTTLSELRRNHENKAVRSLRDLNPGLPPALIDAVTQATAPDPARRPESAAVVQGMLATVAVQPLAAVKDERRPVWWFLAPAIVLVLALTVWAVGSFAPAAPQANSLAVMPLRNLTGDASMQHLADGLSEAVTAQLARVDGISVASPTAVASLQSAFEREIADRVGVRYLLAGSIVQADGRIRINVMINDPRAGRTLWATEFDRTPGTVLDAGTDIVNWVSERLRAR
ncbi:MAG TPA: serine/threonine-protein kinase, partial [Vicinamibacterales bacterium]|nr:serine/threonine-protein kinase [Vicinamibacterales bacterium]